MFPGPGRGCARFPGAEIFSRSPMEPHVIGMLVLLASGPVLSGAGALSRSLALGAGNPRPLDEPQASVLLLPLGCGSGPSVPPRSPRADSAGSCPHR